MAKILLVDDVELFLALEQSYLEPAGHQVVTAHSAKEAMERLAQFSPDLILLDLLMPEMNGDELCRQLRSRPQWQSVPIIMVTSAGKKEEIDNCLAAGANDYLTKPVNKVELLKKVKDLLAGDAPVAMQEAAESVSAVSQVDAPLTVSGDAGEFQKLQQENQRLRRELEGLHARIADLEEENLEFANQIVQIEGVNNNLSNLYIASSRLHSVLNRAKVASIIKEVVINFVGAEKFAILLYDAKQELFTLESSEGLDGVDFPPVRGGEGLMGSVAEGGDCYYREGCVTDGGAVPDDPIAVIPLRMHGDPMGILVIYSLFIQKDEFAPIDYQLFSMLAEHAATALFTSTLYEASERKQKTYKSFMDLLLQQ